MNAFHILFAHRTRINPLNDFLFLFSVHHCWHAQFRPLREASDNFKNSQIIFPHSQTHTFIYYTVMVMRTRVVIWDSHVQKFTDAGTIIMALLWIHFSKKMVGFSSSSIHKVSVWWMPLHDLYFLQLSLKWMFEIGLRVLALLRRRDRVDGTIWIIICFKM